MNYRKLWEENMCKIPPGFVIHHLDSDRKNNDIDNLLMLPADIHTNYHWRKVFVFEIGKPQFDMDNCSLGGCPEGSYYMSMIETHFKPYLSILQECAVWKDYKDYLLGKLPNIHGINLEDYYDNQD